MTDSLRREQANDGSIEHSRLQDDLRLPECISPALIEELDTVVAIARESGYYELAQSLADWRARLVQALVTGAESCPMMSELWLG